MKPTNLRSFPVSKEGLGVGWVGEGAESLIIVYFMRFTVQYIN